jgi:hypothetical protein
MKRVCTKPKLVFFQYRYDANLPEFLLMHKRDHVKCLSEFFEVTVVHEDCDYQQICDKYQPDIALFEGGVNHETCQKLEIRNTGSYPEIPKLGLHNADAWCDARAGFLSDMEHWGIETFFAISTTAAEHMPGIAENLFNWPNFIDDEIYRDYNESKIIPVLLTGATGALYPWRQRIYKLVSEYYPSLICPHRGYNLRPAETQAMYGKQYARTINASWFVPTCGTIAKEVVRKHFEIPACKACLIAEESPALKAAGFVDMKNCVFSDEKEVLDRIDYLLRNRDELEEIISAGYQLVHARHTLKQRDQILQWFNLFKDRKPDQRIVQTNPFGPLTVVVRSSGTGSFHVAGNGLHLALLHQGDEKLWAGKYEEAEGLYFKCANCMRWMPEPKFRVALCNLYKGNAKTAMDWIVQPIQWILAEYKAADPDPVEWAYYVISLLCLGKLDQAIKCGRQFPTLRHPELDRTRWVLNVLSDKECGELLPEDRKIIHRCSIHQLPIRTFDEWIEQLSLMLRACEQSDLAERLKNHYRYEALRQNQCSYGAKKQEILKKGESPKRNCLKKAPFAFQQTDALSLFTKRRVSHNWQFKIAKLASNLLHSLERKFGYFLPYSLSEMRNDEFFSAIRKLTGEENIGTALIVGAAGGVGSTEAFLAGINENDSSSSVFCVNGSTGRFEVLRKSLANDSSVKCYLISSSSREDFSRKLAETVEEIKRENHIGLFDAVLIGSSERNFRLTRDAELYKVLYDVRFILLDDINNCYNGENHHRLLKDPNYTVVAENPGLRKGYAIFKKIR